MHDIKSCRSMVNVDARLFCHILVVLAEHIFENLQILYFFKVLYVTNFTVINKKMTLPCKNLVLSHGKLIFY